MNETEPIVAGVYRDLRRRAARYLKREARGHLLEPNALVHEALLRLLQARSVAWNDAACVLGTATLTMRRILVDHARARRAAKRGGAWRRVPLEGLAVLSPTPDAERLDIRAALEDLAASDVQQAHVVTLRYFEGCSVEEAAGRLGISPATVKREWHRARAWLHRRLRRPA